MCFVPHELVFLAEEDRPALHFAWSLQCAHSSSAFLINGTPVRRLANDILPSHVLKICYPFAQDCTYFAWVPWASLIRVSIVFYFHFFLGHWNFLVAELQRICLGHELMSQEEK